MKSGSWLYLLADEPLDRQSYRLLIQQQLEWNVRHESDLTPTRIWSVLRQRPLLAVLVACRYSSRAADALELIRRVSLRTRTLVVCDASDQTALERWACCPMHGLVPRSEPVEALGRALEHLAAGENSFSPRVARVLEAARRRGEVLPKLSRRERELLPLLASGMTLREAAERMTVSYKTADSYRTSLLRKIGVRDRVALTRWAIRERIIDP